MCFYHKTNVMIQKVFDYVNKVSPWRDDTPDGEIFECAKRAVADILSGAEVPYTKKDDANWVQGSPLLYRLAGQSGSGKTTQLLPTILEYEKRRGNNPVIVAVRSFYKYHPKFAELERTLPVGNLRERTNGFALKTLAAAIALVMERGYLITFDITILDPIFEEHINNLIKSHGYTAEYHILAVPKQQSDFFIEKRKELAQSNYVHSENESGKVVNTETKDYFFDILPRGLAHLASVDTTSTATIWTAYDCAPIYVGKLDGALVALEQGRAEVKELKHSEDELRKAKLLFLKLQYP